MAFLFAALAGFVFGAADQYLGTLSWLGSWPSTVAQISAPWLVLPFLVGMTQERPRRGMLLGVVATGGALVGYFAMTYSPMEIHPWSVQRFTAGFVAVATSGYNPAYILGGLATGPLFGLLGSRWRAHRSWIGPASVAAALCLEPLVRWTTGQLPYHARFVWWIEIGLGAATGAACLLAIVSRRNATTERP